MGDTLDYQGQTLTPPPRPSIYARFFFRLAVVGCVVLWFITPRGISHPMEFLDTPFGCIVGLSGWIGWLACPLLGRRTDVWYWGIGVLLALATLLLGRSIVDVWSHPYG